MAAFASDFDSPENAGTFSFADVGVLRWLGSLKLTVTLFACSMIIVLVGTLAQDEMNMLEVKQRYFLSWISRMHLDDFVPQAFYPHEERFAGVIPFPGGALIGLLLMVNLVAAKLTRFKIHASNSKLITGTGFIAAGLFVTGLIVLTGHNSDGLQGAPPIEYQTLWAFVLTGAVFLAAGLGYMGTQVPNRTVQVVTFFAAALLGLFILYSLGTGFRIGDPGLRIVWQLTQGLGAGVLLLIGCLLIFDKQGGNMLLHLGVALLMLGQFAFGDRQLEQRFSLVEGDSTNTLVNLDSVELTFIQDKDREQEVIAIPSSRLQAALQDESLIEHESLPASIRVLQYLPNSSLVDVEAKNLANTGLGLRIAAAERPKSGGADSSMNVASAYIELLDKDSGDSLGKFLVSQMLSDRAMLIPDGKTEDVFDDVTIEDTKFRLGMRYHREVKPYWVQLEDVRRVNYSGTETPRDYSSFIRIIDPEVGEDRRERVWMNNPLRYRGETFYQSSYQSLPSGKELTGIQVVRNSGWLIPYIACSITALGMLVHFFGTLTRFLKRRERESRFELANLPPQSNLPVVSALVLFSIFAVYSLVPWSAVSNSMRPSDRMTRFDFYEAGKLPVQFGGRVLPLDAYARQTLKAMSNKESLALDESAPSGIVDRAQGKKLSAIQWLMEVAVDESQLRFMPMFRIDAEAVRSELELERRSTKLYSLNEIGNQWSRVNKQIQAAANKDADEMSFKERKLIELDRRTRQYTLAVAAFQLPIPQPINAAEFEKVFPGADDQTRQLFALRELERRLETLKKMSAPAIVAPAENTAEDDVNDPKWEAFGPAFFDHAKSGDDDDQARAGIISFSKIISAYADKDTAAFNDAVDSQLLAFKDTEIRGYNTRLVAVERWMQSNWPTGVAWMLYLACLTLGLVHFLFNLPQLHRAIWGAIAIAFAVHTLAIVCRISVTGRAPVINLYSSAVFVGWAAALFGLLTERIFRYGIGNILAATAGAMTLLVAHGLNKGDTMPVLQAVLDTQFWLTTHVISVSLGYVATLVSGTLGIGYLMAGWKSSNKMLIGVACLALLGAVIYGVVQKDSAVAACLGLVPACYLIAQRIMDVKKAQRVLYRCCYGATCFGILFSFVGTVLGGLWADDSWGRFWGWDPKENGALLIVIWNALILHARWDGMVAARGFATLAIVGNVVTAWSWFGTNELGIGLHSYGFTSGILMWLSLYVASQLAFVAADWLLRWTASPPEAN